MNASISFCICMYGKCQRFFRAQYANGTDRLRRHQCLSWRGKKSSECKVYMSTLSQYIYKLHQEQHNRIHPSPPRRIVLLPAPPVFVPRARPCVPDVSAPQQQGLCIARTTVGFACLVTAIEFIVRGVTQATLKAGHIDAHSAAHPHRTDIALCGNELVNAQTIKYVKNVSLTCKIDYIMMQKQHIT